ncbi:hypothetical protein [Spirillospora albida]|uniref:hypothetical protein n=1 Tax=Spirillospora albida TaxID=58123 RepID=UPI0004C0C016|nr:hypothetical protein [Spirillospora albida]
MAESPKVTVRLPQDVKDAVEAATAGTGQSVTGYVTEAVLQRVDRERRARTALDALGPFTPEELEFAGELLDGGHRVEPGGFRTAS